MTRIPRGRDSRTEIYEQRKLDGKCTYSGRCPEPIVEGRQMCAGHLERAREQTAAAVEKLRGGRRARGFCAYCGKVKSEAYACLRCKVLRGWSPSENVNADVISQGADPAPERFKVGNDGRRRFHGQMVRGRQPVAQLDAQDFRSVMKQLKDFEHEMAIVYSPAVAGLPRMQRESAIKEMLSHLGLASRFIEDILDRHKVSESDMEQMTRNANRRRGGR